MSRPVAIIDFGTITTRLLIVDAHGNEVERDQPVTRMGAALQTSGRIGPDALARVHAVLVDYQQRLSANGVTDIWAIATSAARDAADQDALAALVVDTLGVDLDIIDGETEGRLSFAGATAALAADDPSTLFVVIDIGGGSTEFSYGNAADGLLGVHSIDVGASRVTGTYLESDPPHAAELSAALSVIQLHLDDVVRAMPSLLAAIASGTVIGVGGTISTIGAVEIGLIGDDRSALDHFALSHEAAEDVFRTLATEPRDARRYNPGLPENRVDLIVGGCCVLVESMRHLTIDEIIVSEHDLLDGAAAELRGRVGGASW